MFFPLSSSATCFFAPSVERRPANTLCPELESVSAVRRPKPLDAPVIRIVFAMVRLHPPPADWSLSDPVRYTWMGLGVYSARRRQRAPHGLNLVPIAKMGRHERAGERVRGRERRGARRSQRSSPH